jgi:hypothetical protein
MHVMAEQEDFGGALSTDPERIAYLEAEVSDLRASYERVAQRLALMEKVAGCVADAYSMVVATEDAELGQLGGRLPN